MPRRTVLALAFAVALISASIASAHYIRLDRHVWEDGNGKCLKNRSEISDGRTDGGAIRGYSKVNAFPQKEFGTFITKVPCSTGWERDLRVKAILQKKSGGVWQNCADTGWKYGYATQLQVERYWNADCGSGEYRTRGCTQLKINNAWQPTADSGCIYTGSHSLRR